VFLAPVVFDISASQPRAARVEMVQPKTIPATVGVAAGVAAGEPQQIALEPLDIRTCPAVPQELAQSMMPAPGLIAFVLSPVSQLVPWKPIAS
jgi:hypothetical protein